MKPTKKKLAELNDYLIEDQDRILFDLPSMNNN